MGAMETLSQAITRLSAAGYVEHFYAEGRHLVCGGCPRRFDPAGMTVDDIVRFEGASDPDDQAILYGLTSEDGHRGLYSVAYGPNTSIADTEVLAALPALSTWR